jgi:hypothetical protein
MQTHFLVLDAVVLHPVRSATARELTSAQRENYLFFIATPK